MEPECVDGRCRHLVSDHGNGEPDWSCRVVGCPCRGPMRKVKVAFSFRDDGPPRNLEALEPFKTIGQQYVEAMNKVPFAATAFLGHPVIVSPHAPRDPVMVKMGRPVVIVNPDLIARPGGRLSDLEPKGRGFEAHLRAMHDDLAAGREQFVKDYEEHMNDDKDGPGMGESSEHSSEPRLAVEAPELVAVKAGVEAELRLGTINTAEAKVAVEQAEAAWRKKNPGKEPSASTSLMAPDRPTELLKRVSSSLVGVAAAWDDERAVHEDEKGRLRRELSTLRGQLEAAEQHVKVLKESVEQMLEAHEKLQRWAFAVHRELNLRPGDVDALKALAAKQAVAPFPFTDKHLITKVVKYLDKIGEGDHMHAAPTSDIDDLREAVGLPRAYTDTVTA
jgi:hypothetical protein